MIGLNRDFLRIIIGLDKRFKKQELFFSLLTLDEKEMPELKRKLAKRGIYFLEEIIITNPQLTQALNICKKEGWEKLLFQLSSQLNCEKRESEKIPEEYSTLFVIWEKAGSYFVSNFFGRSGGVDAESVYDVSKTYCFECRLLGFIDCTDEVAEILEMLYHKAKEAHTQLMLIFALFLGKVYNLKN
jgi:hypothetical protein